MRYTRGAMGEANGATGRKHILIVDDEPQIGEVVGEYLKRDGFATTVLGTKLEALNALAATAPDLVILDITLPDGSGLDVLRSIQPRRIPTILLTARAAETDRVVGLELGADDYICKPFSPREVLARVRSVLRRYAGATEAERQPGDVIRIDALEIDVREHAASVGPRPVHLTPSEFKLLFTLAKHPGQTLSRGQLLDAMRDDGSIFERTLDRHVNNIRKKIEDDPSEPYYLQTVYGVGYRLRKP